MKRFRNANAPGQQRNILNLENLPKASTHTTKILITKNEIHETSLNTTELTDTNPPA